jgi:hypothetical protein
MGTALIAKGKTWSNFSKDLQIMKANYSKLHSTGIVGEGIYQIIETYSSPSREGGFGTTNTYMNVYYYDISTQKFLGKSGGKL